MFFYGKKCADSKYSGLAPFLPILPDQAESGGEQLGQVMGQCLQVDVLYPKAPRSPLLSVCEFKDWPLAPSAVF